MESSCSIQLWAHISAPCNDCNFLGTLQILLIGMPHLALIFLEKPFFSKITFGWGT